MERPSGRAGCWSHHAHAPPHHLHLWRPTAAPVQGVVFATHASIAGCSRPPPLFTSAPSAPRSA
eukprot:11145718-Lingulodinium_polyedra.AAC.1